MPASEVTPSTDEVLTKPLSTRPAPIVATSTVRLLGDPPKACPPSPETATACASFAGTEETAVSVPLALTVYDFRVLLPQVPTMRPALSGVKRTPVAHPTPVLTLAPSAPPTPIGNMATALSLASPAASQRPSGETAISSADPSGAVVVTLPSEPSALIGRPYTAPPNSPATNSSLPPGATVSEYELELKPMPVGKPGSMLSAPELGSMAKPVSVWLAWLSA